MTIANRLVELCKRGKNREAVDSLFAEDVVSVEAGGPPGMQRESKGLAALKAKSDWWLQNHEIHSVNVSGPWPHDERFIVGFQYDITNKPSGRRMRMDEAALYEIKNGKIVREEFFYSVS